ncbi:hypothetical protein I6G82_03150 [Lysinibacillus macroides]|uniref:Secreted protein n=1 Tax=Lysinibacillus macroides TaxID=33935 RepID=A0A0M9DIR5_9BACI|nr:hypothetical protein [Lysinibacillus macroides]KOY81200.1 hypothetical protein ADM90_18830 [Lysinibacillus macroides]QPR68646.1 hypothetical protein I6G82_03150 [Lysinibacillus macroides]
MKKMMIGSVLTVGLLLSSAGNSSANSGSDEGIQPFDVQGMDLETALEVIQAQRVQLFEKQLNNQLETVQQRNQQLMEFNRQLGELNNEKVTTPAEATDKQTTLDQQIQDLKSQIDHLNDSQKMEMLRLQSLNNKRNEAFDIMTNFIKKMQDSRSSIIDNMR